MATLMPEPPASRPLVIASAPGKVILFGEHAVVYGEPAIAAAVDRRVRLELLPSATGEPSVNWYPMREEHHAFLLNVFKLAGIEVALRAATTSDLPSAAGLGSSAALTAAAATAALSLAGTLTAEPGATLTPKEEEDVARVAYEAEWLAQGGSGSPTDTATSSHGGAILVDSSRGAGLIRTVTRADRTWHLHDLEVPRLTLVIGNTGARGRTADQVAKVKRLTMKSAFARETVRDIGALVREALPALKAGDAERIGRLMDRNHNLLCVLGVSTPKLDQLVEAARRTSYGAKLTGSGGGGCMIALTDRAAETTKNLERLGAEVYAVKLGGPGARIEPDA